MKTIQKSAPLFLFLLGILVIGCSKGKELPYKLEATERQRLKGFYTSIENFQPLYTGQVLAQTFEVETLPAPPLLRLGVFDFGQGWDLAFSNVVESEEESRPRVATFSNVIGNNFVLAREIPLLRNPAEPGEDTGKLSRARTRLKLEWFDIKTSSVVRTDWDDTVEGRFGHARINTLQLHLLPDLSYLVLMTLPDGPVNLKKFGPDGKLVYSVPFTKETYRIPNWPFVRLAEGDLEFPVLLLNVHESDRAVTEAKYGVKLPASRNNMVYVLLVLNAAGKASVVMPIEEGTQGKFPCSCVSNAIIHKKL